ncbi:TSUP family transporter [Roseomonas sp. CCTCC AB2023176]|uniref:TSUP family transporter n=1 Tax=Roseomonas sp. CCTCC AB2023176 TaxID=3342640 RepID=UPI0035E3641E
MLDPLRLGLANAAIAVATVVQLSVGLGFAMVGAPLLLLIDPRLVPGPFAASALPVLFYQWRADAGEVPRGLLLPATTALLLGTAAGMALAAWQPAVGSRRGCGVVILLCVVLTLAVPTLRTSTRLLAGKGFASGVMGGIAAVHGPLIGLAVSGLPARALRGFLGAFYLVAQASVLLLAFPAGRADSGTWLLAASLLPGMAVGALASPPARRWLVGPRLRIAILTVATFAGGLLVAVG